MGLNQGLESNLPSENLQSLRAGNLVTQSVLLFPIRLKNPEISMLKPTEMSSD